MKRLLILVFLGFGTTSLFSQQTLEVVRGETGSAYEDYLLHTPPNPTGDVGLIVFLHGNGPSNNVEKNPGFERIVEEAMPLAMQTTSVFNQYVDDYYVLIPHHHAASEQVLGETNFTEWNADKVKQFIDDKILEWGTNADDDFPSVDMNRIVVVGFSLGGKGAWDFAEAYPTFPAGVMPTWGSALPEGGDIDYCAMQTLPIWAINGEEDQIFPIDNNSPGTGRAGVNLIENAVLACNPNAPFNKTLLTGRNHLGWDELFRLEIGFDVYDWMTTLVKGSTDYAPIVSVGDDKTILSNQTEYVVYGFALDFLKESFSRTWLVEDITNTLSTPTFNVREETADYVLIEGLESGRTYRIQLTVDDGTTAVADEMLLTVQNAASYSGPVITQVNILYDGTSVPFPTDDVFDIRDVADKNTFNIEGVASSGSFNVETEINEARRFNRWGNTPFTFQDGNSQGFGGAKLQLFDEGLRRMTFTMNIYNFSDVYLATFQVTAQFTDDPSALPITLLSFTGKVADQGVRLDWSTTEEEGNSHFEIYRGRSGDDLVKIGETAKAPPGNLYNYYSFTDSEAREGIYYYQLESVDYDGHRDISKIIRVALTPGEEFQIYPNPATNGQFTITYSPDNEQRPVLFNSRGQQVDFTLAASPNGPGEQQVILKNAVPGMYMLQVWHKGQPETRKVLVE